MHPYPHHYGVRARGTNAGNVLLDTEAVATLETAAPIQFGGPGGQWSPETLLVAAAASCFVLTFRSVATASKLTWKRLDCEADGVLDRRDAVTRFTGLQLRVRLVLPPGEDAERARRLLDKAEKTCLVTSSLNFVPSLDAEVISEG